MITDVNMPTTSSFASLLSILVTIILIYITQAIVLYIYKYIVYNMIHMKYMQLVTFIFLLNQSCAYYHTLIAVLQALILTTVLCHMGMSSRIISKIRL